MFYTYVKLFFYPLVRVYLRLKVEGAEGIPRRGAALLVANHTSFLDPIVLGSACPRKIHFIVLKWMYDLWRLRWFYWGMETIPLRTEEADPRAIKRALTRLRHGALVGIFPEGGRSPNGSLQEGKLGAALLAAVSGVPVIPCAIRGALTSWRPATYFPLPGNVQVRFGSPIHYAANNSRRPDRADLASFSERMMSAIAALASEEKDGGSSHRGRERAPAPRSAGGA